MDADNVSKTKTSWDFRHFVYMYGDIQNPVKLETMWSNLVNNMITSLQVNIKRETKIVL